MRHLLRKILLGALLVPALLLLLPAEAGAVGMSVSGGGTVQPGATVSVRVTFSGENIFGASGSFSYDSSILQYTGGSNTSDGYFAVAGSGDGLSSLSVTMTFKALAVGKCSVSVQCGSSYNYALESLGGGSGSCSVTVSTATAPPQATKAPTGTRKPGVTASPTLPLLVVTLGDASYTLTEPGEDVPEGFTRGETEIDGRVCPALLRESPAAVLVCLTDNTSGVAALYQYDAETRLFSPYIPLHIAGSYVLSADDSRTDVPTGFAVTQPPEGFADAAAWASPDYPGRVLFYVLEGSGQEGYYLYDPAEGTLQRFTETVVYIETFITPRPTAVPTPSPSPLPEATTPGATGLQQGDTLRIVLLSIFGGLLLTAIVLLLLLLIGRSSPFRRPPESK